MINNPLKPFNFFNTPKDIEDLFAHCNLFHGSERTVAFTVAYMAINLAAKMVDQEIAKCEYVIGQEDYTDI